MPLITRQFGPNPKMSKLSIQEMDDNLLYLQGLSQSYFNAGDSSVNTNIDWLNAAVQEINLDGDPTLTFSGAQPGQKLTLLLKQELAGQRTITWPNNVKWSGDTAPSLVSVPGAGSLDLDFIVGSGFNGIVNVVKVQPDGKILVGGAFTTYKGLAAQCLIRLNPDGSKDNSFLTQTWYAQMGNPEIRAIELLPDGSMLVGGSIGGQFSFEGKKWLQKVNADGTWDGSWDAGLNNVVYTIKRQSDGKIVIGGEFSNIGGNYAPWIGRVNSDASYDSTFTAAVNNRIRAIEIQSDGKIVIGGEFSSIGPMGYVISVYGIARLLTDGSYDSSFDTGTKLTGSMGSNGVVYSMILQSDGKIIVGGYFSNYNGTSAFNLLRLNSDATLDTSFATGNGGNFPGSYVYTLSLLPNNKLFVGGGFTQYSVLGNNVICGYIAVVSSIDASFDSAFTQGAGAGANTAVYASAVQLDGKILIGGNFTSMSSVSINRIARINSDATGDAYYNTANFIYNGTNYIGSF